MNGYLRSKCPSEQQLLNELAKLLGAKDVASRKMADVLRALTFFYTSAARGSRIPQSLLSGLCSLLPQLKDKKEIALLKDEHQRIARIALCLLGRLIDQFEIQKMAAARLTDSQRLGEQQSVGPAEQVLDNFLVTLETTVMNPAGLLLPRQRATLRVYAQLCQVFGKRERLLSFTTSLLQQSPVLAENQVNAKGKRLPPPGPAQFGAVAGACHALRFHTLQDDQVLAVDKLVQLAFTLPAGTASRHAAKALLSLLTSTSVNDGRQPNAVTAAKAIEVYLLKARPRTFLGGDSLTSVYLLRLCGQMYRLPVHHQQQLQGGSLTNGPGDSNPSSTLMEASSDTSQQQAPDDNPALRGHFVSNALSTQLQEYLMDVIQGAATDGPATKSTVSPTVLLVAIEEALRGTSPEASFRKQGSMCMFELVAAALLFLLPTPRDPAKLPCNTVTLHRVCRAVQFVAERLDAFALQLSTSSGQPMEIPSYLSQLTLRIRMLTEHNNAFVACEALRAFVWLLPRSKQIGSCGDEWTNLFRQLETLPFNRIQPKRRAAIAWTLFRRCVTTPKSYGYPVEVRLLAGCLRVVLAWFRVRPCMWHAALLTAIWHTALRECLEFLGDDVFSSINELLDFQCAPTDSGAPDCLVVKQTAMQFLSHQEGGMKYVVKSEAWSRSLVLRLTKQALLETCTSQRLSVRALSRLRDEAQLQRFSSLSQQADATLSYLQKLPRQPLSTGLPDGDPEKSFSFHEDPIADASVLAAANDDPFSDFRSPDDTRVQKNEATLENTMLDDPFTDAISSNNVAASNFTAWNDSESTSTNEMTGAHASPVDSSIAASMWSSSGAAQTLDSDTNIEADTAKSAFTNWQDDNSQIGNAEVNFFGNFSAPEGPAESVFAGWEEGSTSITSTNRITSERDSFGSFPPFSSEVQCTGWPENNTDQTTNPQSGSNAIPTSHNTSTTFGAWEDTAQQSPTRFNAFQEDSFTPDFGAPVADFSATPEFGATPDFGAGTSEFDPPAEAPGFDGDAGSERHGDVSGETRGEFGEPSVAEDSAAAAVADSSDSFSVEAQHTTTTTATTSVNASEEASFTPDFGAPVADFSATPEFGATPDFGAGTSEFDPPAEAPGFDGDAGSERHGDVSGETRGEFGEPSVAEDSAAAAVADSSDSFSVEAQHTTTTTATTSVNASEEASFTPDFGAPVADFSATPEFGATPDFGAGTSEFDPPAEAPAFDGDAGSERHGDVSGETRGEFGEPSVAEDSAAAAVADSSDSFSVEAQHTTTTTATTSVNASEEASFTPDFGAPVADFSATPEFGATPDFGAGTSEFDPPAEAPAFDGDAGSERHGDVSGETRGEFGEPSVAEDSAAAAVADSSDSFSVEAQHTTTTTATTSVNASEEASFTPDFGAPVADFSATPEFGATPDFGAGTSEFDPPAEAPAFDGDAGSERHGDVSGETRGEFGEPSVAEDSAAAAVADSSDSFSVEAQHTTTTTATTSVNASEEASFTPDFGAPVADFSATPEFGATPDFGAGTSEFDPPAEAPGFDGDAGSERHGDVSGETRGEFGEPSVAEDSAAAAVADSSDSFSVEAQHTTTTTATTSVNASEEASFTPDFGAPVADFSATPEFGATPDFGAGTSEFDPPAEAPAFDGDAGSERHGDVSGETRGEFGEPSVAEDSAAAAVADSSDSFSVEAQHTTTTTATTSVNASEEASFTPDFGAPVADFSATPEFGATPDFGAGTSEFDPPAEAPAFDGDAGSERHGDVSGETRGEFGEPSVAEDSAAAAVADSSDSFSVEAQHTTTTTATTSVNASEEASFTPDFGAPVADFSATPEFGATPDFGAGTSEFDPPAEAPAFDGDAGSERHGDVSGETRGEFGEPSVAEDSAAAAVADSSDSFSVEAQHTTTTTATTSVNASEEASFTPDFGAPVADFSATPEFGATPDFGAGTSEFDPPAEAPAFDGDAGSERHGDVSGETRGEFGEPSVAEDSAAAAVADSSDSFSVEAQHTTTTTATTSVNASEEASFTPDFGAPVADFSATPEFGATPDFGAGTSEFDPPAEAPGFDGDAGSERHGDVSGETRGEFGEPSVAEDSAAAAVADSSDSFSVEAQHTTTTTATTSVNASEEASFTPDFGAPVADFSATPEFGATPDFGAGTSEFDPPAEAPAFDGDAGSERHGDVSGETRGEFGEPSVAEDSAAAAVADSSDSFSVEAQHTTTTTATTSVNASEEASFTPDFGAPVADFSATPEFGATPDFGAGTSEFDPPAEAPAFDGDAGSERHGDVSGETRGEFGEPSVAEDSAAAAVADSSDSFSVEAQHTTTTTATTSVNASEEASFTPDFGAPVADFSATPEFGATPDFGAGTSEFDPPAEAPAFDGDAGSERHGDVSGETRGEFGEPSVAEDSAAAAVADSSDSFSVEAQHTTTTTATTSVNASEEASFTPDFGAPVADFSATPEFGATPDFGAGTSEFDPPAEAPGFDGDAGSERHGDVSGETRGEFGEPSVAEDSAAAAVADSSDSFSVEAQHTTTTTATTSVNASEEASFTPDFGAPVADFSATPEFGATPDFGAGTSEFNPPAEAPAFDGDAGSERHGDVSGETRGEFGEPSVAEDSAAAAVTDSSDSFSVEAQHTTTTTATTSVNASEEASFTPDFGAPVADFSATPEFGATPDFGAGTSEFDPPAEAPGFDGDAGSERHGDVSGETRGEFGEPSVAEDSAAAAVADSSDSFSVEAQHTTTTTATTSVNASEEASFTPDFGAPVADFSATPEFGATPDFGAGTSEFDPPAEAPAFDGDAGSEDYGDVVAAGRDFVASTVVRNSSLDDEFDEIFGEPLGEVLELSPMGLDDNAERNGQGSGEQPGISKYDEEFDDIFGETEQRQTDAPGLSGSQNEYLLYKNGANADAIGKEHKGDGSQLSSSVEVRSGTPASDYTFR